eukprot:IDg9750t1
MSASQEISVLVPDKASRLNCSTRLFLRKNIVETCYLFRHVHDEFESASNAHIERRLDPGRRIRSLTEVDIFQFFSILYYLRIVRLLSKNDLRLKLSQLPTHALSSKNGMSGDKFAYIWCNIAFRLLMIGTMAVVSRLIVRSIRYRIASLDSRTSSVSSLLCKATGFSISLDDRQVMIFYLFSMGASLVRASNRAMAVGNSTAHRASVPRRRPALET